MKIWILASIWAQNLWDELILKNEIKLLKEEFWVKTKFIVFTYDKKNHFFEDKFVKYKGYFPIWSKSIKNIFRNIWNFIVFLKIIIFSDLIVIWWWGIVYDAENQNTKSPLDLWIFRTKIIRFFRKKIYFFRVWIDIKNKNNFKKLEKIFKNAYKIDVRDGNSEKLLKEIWIKSDVKIDPVFFDKWKANFEKNFCLKKIHSKKFWVEDLSWIDFSWKTIWIAFRSWYLTEKSNISKRMEEGKIKEILNFLEKKSAKIILLPHSFHKTDKKANDYDFLEKFIWKNIKIKNSMWEVYEVYKDKKIDFCISMRLHSMVLAQVYEIPYIWVSYSKKTDEVFSFIFKGSSEKLTFRKK